MADEKKKRTGNLTSWKKGQSGNKAGRPKKIDCLKSLLDEYLEQVAPESTEGFTNAELMIQALGTLAKQGNVKALAIVFDRKDGKVAQPVEMTGKDGEQLKVVVEYANQIDIASITSGSTDDS